MINDAKMLINNKYIGLDISFSKCKFISVIE